ncbi:hypothetical protein HanPSC8_Chr14g0595851 [Helianthus annuus]|nr:hypothetical protein HanPSC8_Chr14g0595851 [Helianthus annuus]
MGVAFLSHLFLSHNDSLKHRPNMPIEHVYVSGSFGLSRRLLWQK